MSKNIVSIPDMFFLFQFLIHSVSSWSQVGNQFQTIDQPFNQVQIVNRKGDVKLTGKTGPRAVAQVKISTSQIRETCQFIQKVENNILIVGNEPRQGSPASAACPASIEVEIPDREGIEVMVDVEFGRLNMENIKSHAKLEVKGKSATLNLQNVSFDNMRVSIEDRGDILIRSRHFQDGEVSTPIGNIKVVYDAMPDVGVMEYRANAGNVEIEVPVNPSASSLATAYDAGSASSRIYLRNPKPTSATLTSHSFTVIAPKGVTLIRHR